MRPLFVFFLFQFAATFSWSQDWREDTLQLKGPVKSVVHVIDDPKSVGYALLWEDEYHYLYNEQGYLVQSERYNGEPIRQGEFRHRIYDNEGLRLIRDSISYQNGRGGTSSHSLDYDSISRTVQLIDNYPDGYGVSSTYFYNARWQLTHFDAYIQFTGDTIRKYFEYDDQHRLIRTSIVGNSSSDKSKEVESWLYNDQGQLLEHSELNYDQDDVLVQDDYSKHFYYTETYHYNSSGLIDHTVRTNILGEKIKDLTSTYNDSGDVKMATYTLQDGSLDISSFVYEYDAYGNWKSKVCFVEEKIYMIETRKIDYYE